MTKKKRKPGKIKRPPQSRARPEDREACGVAEAAAAWREYLNAQEDEREKTARLRAARLAREHAATRRKRQGGAHGRRRPNAILAT